MKKTIKQWLEECTEPWAINAFKYTIEDGRTLEFNAISLGEALLHAFNWSQTEEGYTYWFNIHFDLEQREGYEKDV